ncbi:MAG: hypothetical protein EOO40_09780 [Deltaproteobacteria bacterium]|nr:MAG: hypothetical protein EOO40_09780 [Deltaproteobacteria bacterium]
MRSPRARGSPPNPGWSGQDHACPMGALGSTRRQRVLWGVGLGVVLAAVAVNAVLALFRAVGPLLARDPSPSPPAASSPALPSVAAPTAPRPVEPASDVRLPGAGSDVVFAQSAAAIYRINLATGAVVRTNTPELTQFSSCAYQAGPDGLRRLASGQLLAVGTHQVLSWDCNDQAQCNAYRTVRATGRRTLVLVARRAVLDVYQGDQDDASSSRGVLSPDGTHAALAGSSRPGNDRPLFVLDLRTGRDDLLPGSTADVNPNAQVAWTANSRWLLALTDNQLRAYDTTTGTVQTLSVGEPLQHLVSANAAGF